MEPEGPGDPREHEPLLAGASLSQRPSFSSPPPISADVGEAGEDEMNIQNMSRKSQWIILALASGGCAAFNGVFAKLYVYVILLVSLRLNVLELDIFNTQWEAQKYCCRNRERKREQRILYQSDKHRSISFSFSWWDSSLIKGRKHE
jgi:hypothetical protein